MQVFKLKTRAYSDPIIFSCPDDGGYVWITWPDGITSQACVRGSFSGTTVYCDGNLATFARAWWRDYMRKNR